MRPEFGCAVHDLVFDTIDAAMIGKLETAIRAALDRWEPRIEVEDLDVRPLGRRRGPAADHHRLPRPRDEQPAQPRLPLLRDPGGGERVRLPAIELDDRRFQDLVSEARLRINRACPEWTEHNVSDPGITLIELFAWMTEMTIYRLNRVPDKLHVALMELLGIRLDGPTGGAHEPALPAERAGRAEHRHPRRGDRGRHAAHGDRGVDRVPGRRGLHDPAGPARPPTSSSAATSSARSAWSTGRPSRRAPTRCRSARRRWSATRSTSASRRTSAG